METPKDAKEVERREWLPGVFIITVEYPAWKIVGNAWCQVSFGPFASEDEAKQFLDPNPLRGETVWPYIHRETYYERFGKRVK